MTDYRYKLKSGGSKFKCPSCGKKTFVRFIDSMTGDFLPSKYGRCDREINCGYFLNPYKDGLKGNSPKINSPVINRKDECIPADVLKSTLKGYDENIFIRNLLYNVSLPFNEGDIERVISLYFLGTVTEGSRKGALTIPFIDYDGRVRAVQVKQFDNLNHTTGTDFLHSILIRNYGNSDLPEWLQRYQQNESKVSCMFGEHLLKHHPFNPVALVEAPKTAIYGTLYFGFPDNDSDLIWLSAYNVSGLTERRCQALRGRRVILFPDLSSDSKAFKLWQRRAEELSNKLPGSRFKVSDILEKESTAEQRKHGLDLADFLIQRDWMEYREYPSEMITQGSKSDKSDESDVSKPTLKLYPDRVTVKKWDHEIMAIEEFLCSKDLPKVPIRVNQYETITDADLFVKSHLDIVRYQNGNPRYRPYLDRLLSFKQLLN